MKASALDEVFSSLASVMPEQERERVFEEIILQLTFNGILVLSTHNLVSPVFFSFVEPLVGDLDQSLDLSRRVV